MNWKMKWGMEEAQGLLQRQSQVQGQWTAVVTAVAMETICLRKMKMHWNCNAPCHQIPFFVSYLEIG